MSSNMTTPSTTAPCSTPGASTSRNISVSSLIEPTDVTPTCPKESPTPAKKRQKVAIKREGEPPRNAEGKIHCIHPDCQGLNLTFAQPCAWNKHMDRHERPYKCKHEKCVNRPGFTYSGGLLRHKREVHDSTTPRVKCPVQGCERRGNGFTRTENFAEHLRRRHPPLYELFNAQSKLKARSKSTQPSDNATSSKAVKNTRKRTTSASSDDSDELRGKMARLKTEIKRAEVCLGYLEKTVKELGFSDALLSDPEDVLNDLRQTTENA